MAGLDEYASLVVGPLALAMGLQAALSVRLALQHLAGGLHHGHNNRRGNDLADRRQLQSVVVVRHCSPWGARRDGRFDVPDRRRHRARGHRALRGRSSAAASRPRAPGRRVASTRPPDLSSDDGDALRPGTAGVLGAGSAASMSRPAIRLTNAAAKTAVASLGATPAISAVRVDAQRDRDHRRGDGGHHRRDRQRQGDVVDRQVHHRTHAAADEQQREDRSTHEPERQGAGRGDDLRDHARHDQPGPERGRFGGDVDEPLGAEEQGEWQGHRDQPEHESGQRAPHDGAIGQRRCQLARRDHRELEPSATSTPSPAAIANSGRPRE